MPNFVNRKQAAVFCRLYPWPHIYQPQTQIASRGWKVIWAYIHVSHNLLGVKHLKRFTGAYDWRTSIISMEVCPWQVLNGRILIHLCSLHTYNWKNYESNWVTHETLLFSFINNAWIVQNIPTPLAVAVSRTGSAAGASTLRYPSKALSEWLQVTG